MIITNLARMMRKASAPDSPPGAATGLRGADGPRLEAMVGVAAVSVVNGDS
jgi:hypothetical protein